MAKYVPPHLRERKANKPTGNPAYDNDVVTEHPPSHYLSFCKSDNDPVVQHFLNISPTYNEWRITKRDYGSSPEVDHKFEALRESQRSQGEAAYSADAWIFRGQFMGAFKYIYDCISPTLCEGGVDRFMDLGCAPGGFSKALLEYCKDAKGLGVTLPVHEYGLPMPMQDWTDDERGRYELWEYNLLHLPDDFHTRIGSFFSGNLCDLVICGAVYRDSATLQSRETVPIEDRTDATGRPALELTQLSIAFRHLKKGGTLISVSTLRIFVNTVETLLFLRSHFAKVTPVKSSNLHCVRSTYYLVCQGFLVGDERMETTKHIEQALTATEWDGSRVSLTECIGLKPGSELVAEETEYLLRHFEPLWKQQTDALKLNLETLRRKRPTFHLGNPDTIRLRSRSDDWRTKSEMRKNSA